MSSATVVYPHQLFQLHPALHRDRCVYLVEEPLFLTEFPTHSQKLLLHRLSMQAYKEWLEAESYNVTYLTVHELSDTAQVFEHIAADGITELHIVDTTDDWLEQRINAGVAQHSMSLVRYESPLFLLSKADAMTRYTKSGKHMARFYARLRADTGTLLTLSGEPQGGKWSFDADNRKRLPRNAPLPRDIIPRDGEEIAAARVWLAQLTGERYGEESVWIPWTHADAEVWLAEFLRERLSHFGDYEDAIRATHVRLFHSTLSPLLNIGLLTPREVVDAAVMYGKEHHIPLNNIEGFVRQVLGWREFIRASYECDGRKMRTRNFWRHTRSLPAGFWNADTGIPPIDGAIQRALRFGYAHHIERLMVLGNFLLLTRTDPDHVYRWFMAMFVDAYDWVMVPNIYGMSQFADGGIFATKPYISGSNYLKKMSDYPRGEWEDLWTALYWDFIREHEDVFSSNHRLAMMPKMLEKMDPARRSEYRSIAEKYFVL